MNMTLPRTKSSSSRCVTSAGSRASRDESHPRLAHPRERLPVLHETLLVHHHVLAVDLEDRVARRLEVEVEVALGLRAELERDLVHRGRAAVERHAVPQPRDRPMQVAEGDETDAPRVWDQ